MKHSTLLATLTAAAALLAALPASAAPRCYPADAGGTGSAMRQGSNERGYWLTWHCPVGLMKEREPRRVFQPEWVGGLGRFDPLVKELDKKALRAYLDKAKITTKKTDFGTTGVPQGAMAQLMNSEPSQ